MYKISFIIIFSLFLTFPAWGCTRILHAAQGQAVMVGRNMDWFEDLQTKLIVYPRGIVRNGNTEVFPLVWGSKYGSIIADAYNAPLATDGMNEKGLSAHILWLAEADYGRRNWQQLGLSVSMWVQYYLDNFATVDEAVRFTQRNTFQVTPYFHPVVKRWINVHLALEDETGDSAIIEYVNGVAKIYHDSKYTAVTNSPTYDWQIENLKQYTDLGGNKPLPGTGSPPDRLVRATYYNKTLAKAYSTKEEVAGILSVLQNVGAPYQAYSADNTKVHRTIWRTISDLSHHVYYFSSTANFNTLYVQLDKFNLNAGWPVMQLDLNKKSELVGDVSGEFEKRTI